MSLFFLSMLLGNLATISAQEEGKQPNVTHPQAESQPATSNASATPENLVQALADARKKAEDDYLSLLVKMDDDAILRLKELAKQSAADGDLAAARQAWTQLRILDPNNIEAKEFCEALGIWPQVQKQLAKSRSKSSRTNARIEYQCESGRVFRKLSNGLWSDSQYAPMYQEIDRNEYSVSIMAMTATGETLLLLPDQFIFAKRSDWDKGKRYRNENGAWVR